MSTTHTSPAPAKATHRGITAAPGLAFVGLPWQHTRGSALLGFVQHDAAWIAGQLEAQRPQRIEYLVGCVPAPA